MNLKALFLPLFLAVSSLAAVRPPLDLPKDFGSIITYNKDRSGGSACPVGIGAFALTAKHISEESEAAAWIDPLSPGAHPLFRIWESKDQDLAKVTPEPGTFFPHPHPIAKHPPTIDEEVIIYGAVGNAPTVWHGRVLGLMYVFPEEESLLIDSGIWPGSSGGCVLSLKTRELYGIVTGSVYPDQPNTGRSRPLSFAAPVWGFK